MASVQEFFDGLAARVSADRIAGMTNTYVFDIEGAGIWTVAIADGAIDVSEGAGDADCTLSATEESFEKIVAGEQNATTAWEESWMGKMAPVAICTRATSRPWLVRRKTVPAPLPTSQSVSTTSRDETVAAEGK